jgi:hypothetical protein
MLAIVVLVASQCLIAHAAPSVCSGFAPVTDSPFPFAYAFNPTLAKWSNGDSGCSTLNPGARLGSIRDRLVHTLVLDYATNVNYPWVAARQTSSLSEPAGNWFWSDGSLPNGTEYDPRYFLWAQGYPMDTPFMNCARMGDSPPGLVDDQCAYDYDLFCEVHGEY